MKPYFYKIREITSGKYYVGCQYGKKSDPTNFWTTYFTSNQYIKSQSKDNFKIVKIVQRDDAREYEKRYLNKCYKLLGRDNFLNLMINRNLAPGILNTPESIARGNLKRKVSNSLAAKKRIDDGTHNFLNHKYEHSDEWKNKISVRMRGENNPSKNPESQKKRITDEFRKKQAAGAKGNTNVKGYRWWSNGISYTRSKECPGNDFYLKAPPISENSRKKISVKNKGRIMTEEHKEKLSKSAKNRPANSKGTIWVKNENGVRKRVNPNNIPEGFFSVKENI